jgi:hypothetical protein
MIMANGNSVAKEMAALQQKMDELRAHPQNESAARPNASGKLKISKRRIPHCAGTRKAPKTQHRIGRDNIAPGINLTTLPGSMYSAMARALAIAGSLGQHDTLFNAFLRKPSKTAALTLVKKIGLSRDEMEMFVRANQAFREHCDDRTRRIKKALATGSAAAKAKAAGVLKNPKICRSGCWIGDLDEGVSIWSGARTLEQVRKGRNLQSLNKAGLMFDTMSIGGTQTCFLYKQKWHRPFLQAVALATA